MHGTWHDDEEVQQFVEEVRIVLEEAVRFVRESRRLTDPGEAREMLLDQVAYTLEMKWGPVRPILSDALEDFDHVSKLDQILLFPVSTDHDTSAQIDVWTADLINAYACYQLPQWLPMIPPDNAADYQLSERRRVANIASQDAIERD